MKEALRRWACSAGLIAGPACWVVNTQAAYTVASEACLRQREILTPTMLALIAITAASAVMSGYSVRSVEGEWFDACGGAANRLLAVISVGAAILFGLVIADQLAAMLILEGCLR
jgi:hypothetical protein